MLAVLLVGCAGLQAAPTGSRPARPSTSSSSTTTATTPPTTTTAPTTTTTVDPFARPAWLGTRVLPLGPDGVTPLSQPTPPELRDRRLDTLDLLPPPPDDRFVSTIGPVPDDVLARSTWSPECPVSRDDLAYLTVAHFGFDGRFHTGELIVNASVAQAVAGVFEQLHAARFPIEQMRVVSRDDLEAPPTGDGNDTSGFVCRPAVGSGSWSQHAYGLAVDVDPFHNPYVKGDRVLPELATAYVDRSRDLPGMITEGDVVVRAFAGIGWTWGGQWQTLKDWMHFSRNGR